MNKQKKGFLTIIMLVTMLMGIGYATINAKTLTITGKVGTVASQDNFKVVFTGNVTESDEEGTMVEASATNGATTATLNFNDLTKSTDGGYAIFEILNDSDGIAVASITATAAGSSSDIISITATRCDEDGNVVADETEIAAGAKAYVKVSVSLSQAPTATNENAAQISVTITATPKDVA